MTKPFLNPSLDRAGFDQKIKEILEILKKRHWTMGIMESCTGGAIANAVTNIPGASDVFRVGKVAYSVESKIEAGVDREIIKKYGVFSTETAEEMVRKIGGTVGVGVTGNMNDPGEVFVAVRIGSVKQNKIVSEKILVESKKENEIEARKEKKNQVVEKVMEMIVEKL